jgi:hypothetical protein
MKFGDYVLIEILKLMMFGGQVYWHDLVHIRVAMEDNDNF